MFFIQFTPPPPQAPESATITIVAGQRYRASGLHRLLAGGTYRELWSTPMRVPVLDVRTFAGGLHPTKEGGGNQTKSLRFKTADSTEYVFRLTDKTATGASGRFKNALTDAIFQDQVSAMHPAGAEIAAPIMTAAGVLHPTGALMVMADDSLLGKFRHEFAGRLGIIEEYPNVPEHGPGFGGARKIIDSDDLLKLLNEDASQRIDGRAFLAARLIDFLINDNDRHEGNWKWARMDSGSTSAWEPIARDRDHAFVSYGGLFAGLGRLAASSLVSFGNVPDVEGLTQNGGLDARLLAGLERPVWDSVARAVQARVTDSVIRDALRAMPAEYYERSAHMEATLRSRRNALGDAADRFYRQLAARVAVHATDSSDRAVVTRERDGVVGVTLSSAGKTFFSRRFDAGETSEILVYLHGGNDSAIVTGRVDHSILVRIIGGNGENTLIDSSVVGRSVGPTHLYDVGKVEGVSYGPKPLLDRRPWEMENGKLTPPHDDYGSGIEPLAGLTVGRIIGVTPRIGIARHAYGFGQRPYDTMVELEGAYAFEFRGARVHLVADGRLESSGLHFTSFARMSDLEVVSYHGLGNATTSSGPSKYYEVRQRQWLLHPSIALATGPQRAIDISIGPVIQHSNTRDAVPGRYLTSSNPYGVGAFDQAGVQAGARYDWREPTAEGERPRHKVFADVSGSYFPAMMSVRTPFEAVTATLGASLTLPVPTHPLLVTRAGGKKLYGTFPFHEAASIGGESTLPYLDPQRYSGDASLYGTSELRIPVADFEFVAPLRAGVLGHVDAGRVYDHGQSPGSWHARTGAGVWVGMRTMSSVLTVASVRESGRTFLQFGLGFNGGR